MYNHKLWATFSLKNYTILSFKSRIYIMKEERRILSKLKHKKSVLSHFFISSHLEDYEEN